MCFTFRIMSWHSDCANLDGVKYCAKNPNNGVVPLDDKEAYAVWTPAVIPRARLPAGLIASLCINSDAWSRL